MSRPFAIGQPSDSIQKTTKASAKSSECGAPRRNEGEKPLPALVTSAPDAPRASERSLELRDAARAVDPRRVGEPEVGLRGAPSTRPRTTRTATSRRPVAEAALGCAVSEAERAEPVAQARVERELAALEAALERVVVDDERRVEAVERAGAVRPVRIGHVAGDALLRVPLERDELRHVLAHAVLERADREVQDLDREPAAQGDEPCAERLVVPAADANVGAARCADLKCVLSGCGWNDGAQSRAVIRSAKKRSSSGRGTKLRHAPRTTPKRCGNRREERLKSPPRGHQNSSASVLRTQSAPNSVAASRAIRVTHSLWRRSSPGSRIRWRCPSRA